MRDYEGLEESVWVGPQELPAGSLGRDSVVCAGLFLIAASAALADQYQLCQQSKGSL